MTFLKKCDNCGNDDFDINEFIVHRAGLSEDDLDLTVYKIKNNGIEMIVCTKCQKEFSSRDFKQINF